MVCPPRPVNSSKLKSFIGPLMTNPMCQLTWAAIIKYHRLGELTEIFSYSLEALSPKLGSSEGSASPLQKATFSLCPQMTFPWCACEERFLSFPLLTRSPAH